MFVDRVEISVQAGKGGDGCVAFRREKFDPKGGPFGGDGGKGGSVIIQVEEGMSTLDDFRHQKIWEAKPGEDGRGKQQHGADSPDLILRVPPGTLVYNAQTDELMHDLKPGDRVVIARGGRGGFGNEHFKSSTNQTPRTAQSGEEGEYFDLKLELKLIADVGLVGKPNAGKSTMLKALTRANPKIGSYPFTTLSPQLGIATLSPGKTMVLADVPGLIEGAAGGAGLGHEFLRHVERTRVLVHVLDAQPIDGTTPAENYKAIRAELGAYSPELERKIELVALNKLDLIPDEAEREKLIKKVSQSLKRRPGKDLFPISGATGLGLPELLKELWSRLHPAGADLPGWTPTPATGE